MLTSGEDEMKCWLPEGEVGGEGLPSPAGSGSHSESGMFAVRSE